MNANKSQQEPGTETGTRNLPPGGIQIECREIKQYLFGYLTHELGSSRSELVRTHLHNCRDCRNEAIDLEETIKLLKSKPVAAPPEQLDEKRRRRLHRAVWHPFWNWAAEHHKIISLILALTALTIFFIWMVKTKPEMFAPRKVYTVNIGMGQPSQNTTNTIPLTGTD